MHQTVDNCIALIDLISHIHMQQPTASSCSIVGLLLAMHVEHASLPHHAFCAAGLVFLNSYHANIHMNEGGDALMRWLFPEPHKGPCSTHAHNTRPMSHLQSVATTRLLHVVNFLLHQVLFDAQTQLLQKPDSYNRLISAMTK